MATPDTRFALTALDIKHKDFAVPDEILIDKETGKFYYKKLDGEIVATDAMSSEELQDLIKKVEEAAGIGGGGIVSAEKPNDDDWKPGGCWYETVRIIDGTDPENLVNVTFTNVTFDQNDLEKVFIQNITPQAPKEMSGSLDVNGDNPDSYIIKSV